MLVNQLFSFPKGRLIPCADLSFTPLLLNVPLVGRALLGVKQIISSRFQLKPDFAINILDAVHLLFRFNNETDFLLVWLK